MTKRKYVYVVREKNDWLDHIKVFDSLALAKKYLWRQIRIKFSTKDIDDLLEFKRKGCYNIVIGDIDVYDYWILRMTVVTKTKEAA